MSQINAERVVSNVLAEKGRNRLTNREIADVLSVHEETVRRRLALAPGAEFSLEDVGKLAVFFDVPVERLLGLDERAAS